MKKLTTTLLILLLSCSLFALSFTIKGNNGLSFELYQMYDNIKISTSYDFDYSSKNMDTNISKPLTRRATFLITIME
jgi:hypothetical protein